MGKRRLSRELAVQFLYLTEMNPEDREQQLQLFWENHDCPPEVRSFTEDILNDIFSHKEEIDSRLEQFSDNWTLSRMAVIDRNLLRMAASEILYSKTVPPKVAIDEAVEISKRFGTEDSPNFINGILDRILKEVHSNTPQASLNS